MEYQPLGAEKLRADKGQDEAFKGHAVVGKKAAQGKGEDGQDTHPANLPGIHRVAQPKVHSYGHQHGQQSEQELPQGQAEEQAFLVVPDFFVDTNFYGYHFFLYSIS